MISCELLLNSNIIRKLKLKKLELRLFLIIRSKNSGANSNNNVIIESDIIITTVITINSILILSLLVTSSSVDISIAAAVQSGARYVKKWTLSPVDIDSHRIIQSVGLRLLKCIVNRPTV